MPDEVRTDDVDVVSVERIDTRAERRRTIALGDLNDSLEEAFGFVIVVELEGRTGEFRRAYPGDRRGRAVPVQLLPRPEDAPDGVIHRRVREVAPTPGDVGSSPPPD